ncbi:hypothetical protein ACFVHQ_14060 [Actinomycetes bacterium NPDC127524]
MALAGAGILLAAGLLFTYADYHTLMDSDSHLYKGTFKQLGSIARIGFFAAAAVYPVFLLLKWKKLKKAEWGSFKPGKVLQVLAKYVRKWHTPIALVSAALVLLHGTLAILRGFTLDFTYMTGMLGVIVLGFLTIMGFKRFKRNDRKLHFKLAIVFILVFMIHATFA